MLTGHAWCRRVTGACVGSCWSTWQTVCSAVAGPASVPRYVWLKSCPCCQGRNRRLMELDRLLCLLSSRVQLSVGLKDGRVLSMLADIQLRRRWSEAGGGNRKRTGVTEIGHDSSWCDKLCSSLAAVLHASPCSLTFKPFKPRHVGLAWPASLMDSRADGWPAPCSRPLWQRRYGGITDSP